MILLSLSSNIPRPRAGANLKIFFGFEIIPVAFKSVSFGWGMINCWFVIVRVVVSRMLLVAGPEVVVYMALVHGRYL